jgi:hypothetical protein
MPDYQNGKIYMIWCGDDKYYGSTIRTLSARMSKHRYIHKQASGKKTSACVIFDKHGTDNCKIELVELFPCHSKDELEAREGFYIRNNNCVNKIIPDRTRIEYNEVHRDDIKVQKQDYYTKNKDIINERNTSYYQANKEKYSEKTVCRCGGSYTVKNKKQHEKTALHLKND